jgi:hypothetical protein
MPKACNNNASCPCSTNPFANLSSEDPDHLIFIGLGYYRLQPPLGSQFHTADCFEDCESLVSQYDADQCAARNAKECVTLPCLNCTPNPCDNPPGCPPCEPPCQPVPCIPNTQQGCQSGQFYSQVNAGEYCGNNQADADAIAASICQHRLTLPDQRIEIPAGCPVIEAIFPASPVTVDPGETVVLSASVTFTTTDPVTYLWLFNGLPLEFTITPVLTLTNVGLSDAGVYSLEVSAPGCPTTISETVELVVNNPCVEDFGPLPPSGATPFEISGEVEWETFSVNTGDYVPVVSGNVGCNPTGLSRATWAAQPDHPPGTYKLEYLSGFFEEIVPACGDPVCAVMHVHRLWDLEHNFDTPLLCDDFQCLANAWVFCFCNGQFNQGATRVIVQGLFSATFAAGNRYEYTIVGDNVHTQDGGDFSIGWDDATAPLASYFTPATYDMTFKVVQATGLIQQPRKLAIFNWNTIKLDLPAGVQASWDGEIDTRTFYSTTSPTQLQYDEPAVGGFGGAQVSYTQAHPTSPNGCGWVFEIYSPGAVLAWRGFKITNDFPYGNYIKDPSFTSDLGCITLLDNT